MKYVILNTSELDTVEFNQVLEHSAPMLRYSLDGTQFLLKFQGDTPSFLSGKTTHTLEEIKVILAGDEWTSDEII